MERNDECTQLQLTCVTDAAQSGFKLSLALLSYYIGFMSKNHNH